MTFILYKQVRDYLRQLVNSNTKTELSQMNSCRPAWGSGARKDEGR